jgi:Ca2+-binding RTX toxin-like protein
VTSSFSKNDTITASAYSGDLSFSLGGGNDSVLGGLGNDTFSFTGSDLNASDVLSGGKGNDTIRLTNDTADAGTVGDAVTAVVKLTASAAVEQIVVNDTATDNAAGDVSITFDAAYAQEAITVDGSALDEGEDLTVDASAIGEEQYFTVTGGAGNDTLTGGGDADLLAGGAGADALSGGEGADTLTGGEGADTFTFASGDSVPGTVDKVTDFVSGTDKLVINLTSADDSIIFTPAYRGTTASNAEGLSLLTGKAGAYFFNTSTNQLVMDVDGNGLIQATDLVITLDGQTKLTASDIQVTLEVTAASAVTGGASADTITGSGGADTITGEAGADDLTGNGGNDVFVFGNADSGLTVATADTILDFATGADDLDLGTAGDATGGTGNYVEAGAAVADFAAALTAANTALAALAGTSAAIELFAFEFDATNGYLFNDTDGDGDADQVIVLTGINGGEIAAGDIIA